MNISGTVGISVIKHEDTKKFFIILYDDHSNNRYCNDKIFVHDLIYKLYTLKKKFCCFVEEPIYNDTNMSPIWHNIYHVKMFSEFCDKYKNKICINKTDIRQLIIPCSMEFIVNNPKYANMTIKDFMKNIILFSSNQYSFMNYVSKYDIKKIHFYIYIINNIQLIFNTIDINQNISKIINNTQLLLKIDTLILHIMDLYTITILMASEYKLNVIYYGLIHSYNICYWLYRQGYKIKYHHGFDLFNLDLDVVEKNDACVKI